MPTANNGLFLYNGTCDCTGVHIDLCLPKPLQQYAPRVCDCDFCQFHHISYLSDLRGQLTLCSSSPLTKVQQGSLQASFLCCANCQDVVAVTFDMGSRLKGAVNANLLDLKMCLLPGIMVAPKTLTPEQKVTR